MDLPEDVPDRRAFLAHDIRAAVADVIGGLRLVDMGELPGPTRKQLGRVRVTTELLSRLVEDLLEDAPRSEASFEVVDLQRFLEDELRRWQGAGRPAGVAVRLVRAPDLPDIVRLDGLRLRRIVANLMGKALRHGAGGAVELGAEIHGDGRLSIRVAERGPGFPPTMLAGAFPPPVAGRGGAGMELQIARVHVAELSGDMTARNPPGGGAEVVVEFPATVWRLPERTQELDDLPGRRVLVVDDSGTNRSLVCAMLERLGMECESARDGIEALDWLSRERFDLGLIDLEMPRLGGLEVIRSERRRQARGMAPPIPLVAMTAHPDGMTLDALREAGADGVLEKPLPEMRTFGRAVLAYLAGAPDARDWAPCVPRATF